MKSISPEISRYVQTDRAQNLYLVHDQRKALLAESKACVENSLLAAWRPESEALARLLASALQADEARIAHFEASLPTLEKSAALEGAAKLACARAQHGHACGSLVRSEAITLRENLEASESALRVRSRERAIAAQDCSAGLPSTNQIHVGPGREIVESLLTLCVNRLAGNHSTRGEIDPTAWRRWLDMSEGDWQWLPLHAQRALAKLKSSRKESRRLPRPNGSWYEVDTDGRVDPADVFVKEFSALKSARVAHQRQKAAAAQRAYETAQASLS